MPDLRTRYLGLPLRSPLVASSSPLTGRLGTLRQLEDAGAAAVVLPSLFEEQLTTESLEIDRLLEAGAGSFGEALDYFPDLDDYDTGPGRSLELWVIGEGKSPRSLGVLKADTVKLRAPEVFAGGVQPETAKFAVTVEPEGGSPTGGPTGPVVYSGALIRD